MEWIGMDIESDKIASASRAGLSGRAYNIIGARFPAREQSQISSFRNI